MKNRKHFLYALIIVTLLISVVWSYSFMAGREKSASGAKTDLQRCTQIINQLQILQQKPKLASDHERLSSETTGIIENAARSAGIAPGNILRITPQPQRRINDTAYKEKPTGVTLKGITLREFFAMASTLAGDENSLDIKSVNITAPDINDMGEKWNVDLVLTYFIYDPISTSKKEI